MVISSPIRSKEWARTDSSPRPVFVAIPLLFVLLLFLSCSRGEAVVQSSEEVEARTLLLDYLSIDTSNPPGNETRAAEFFKDVFDREGIATVLAGPEPSRQSIIARLDSGTSNPSLVLLHHMDVVPAEAEAWTRSPFQGVTIDGYIWGRGSLDAKSLGIAQLASFLELHRSQARLVRDVVFVAVADEEAGGMGGTNWLLENRPELFRDAGWVLNEGGANEVIVDKVAFWGIEVDQKVPLWVTVRTAGSLGHSAVPPDDGGAAARLLALASEILAEPGIYEIHPSVDAYFSALKETKKGRKKELLENLEAAVAEPDFEDALSDGYRSLLRNTIGLTKLHAGSTINVIPARAEASFDIRLLPGESAEATLLRIREIVGDRGTIEVHLLGKPAAATSVDTPLYESLSRHLLESEPGSVVGPLVTPGTTDCRFFRMHDTPCYGFSPFKVNYYDGDRVHGVDEKIRAKFFDEGVRLMRIVVRDFATSSSQNP